MVMSPVKPTGRGRMTGFFGLHKFRETYMLAIIMSGDMLVLPRADWRGWCHNYPEYVSESRVSCRCLGSNPGNRKENLLRSIWEFYAEHTWYLSCWEIPQDHLYLLRKYARSSRVRFVTSRHFQCLVGRSGIRIA